MNAAAAEDAALTRPPRRPPSWSGRTARDGCPYEGPRPGRGVVVIRPVGGGAALDRGRVLWRNEFGLLLRSEVTGRRRWYRLLRVRVEPARRAEPDAPGTRA